MRTLEAGSPEARLTQDPLAPFSKAPPRLSPVLPGLGEAKERGGAQDGPGGGPGAWTGGWGGRGGGLHSGRLRLTPSWSGQPWGLLVNLAPPGG